MRNLPNNSTVSEQSCKQLAKLELGGVEQVPRSLGRSGVALRLLFTIHPLFHDFLLCLFFIVWLLCDEALLVHLQFLFWPLYSDDISRWARIVRLKKREGKEGKQIDAHTAAAVSEQRQWKFKTQRAIYHTIQQAMSNVYINSIIFSCAFTSWTYGNNCLQIRFVFDGKNSIAVI